MITAHEIPLIVSRWLHLAAVIVAIGGTVFLRLVLHSTARNSLPEREQGTLMTAVVSRWSRVLHICIGLILLTGTYNAVVMLGRHQGQPVYHSLFGMKVLLAFVLFFLAIAITGRSAAFAGLRQNRARWMSVNIALAGLIVLFSNILKFLPLSS